MLKDIKVNVFKIVLNAKLLPVMEPHMFQIFSAQQKENINKIVINGVVNKGKIIVIWNSWSGGNYTPVTCFKGKCLNNWTTPHRFMLAIGIEPTIFRVTIEYFTVKLHQQK